MNRSGTPSHNRPPLNSSASNSSADNNNSNDSAYKAALRGASLAFQNTGSKAQSSVPQARNIDTRALQAATSTAHHYGLSPSRSPPRTKSSTVSRQTTGSSVRSSVGTTSGHEVDQGAVAQGHPAAQFLAPPGKQTAPDAKSPSFIAATLAASRSGSPSPRQPANPHPYQQAVRRQQGGAHSAATSVASLDLAADTAPLPSTNALISMFERKEDDTGPVKDPVKKPVVSNSSNKPPISKPKPKPKPRPVTPPRGADVVKQPIVSPAVLSSPPVRATPGSDSARQPTSEGPGTQRGSTGLKPKKSPPTPPPPRSTTNQVEESPSEKAVLPKRKPRASTPPRSIASANTSILSPQPRRASSKKILSHRSSDEDDTVESRSKVPPVVKPKPQRRASVQHVENSPAPLEESPRPIVLVDEERRPSSSSSNDTFVSAESEPTPQPALPRRPGKVPSTPDPPRVRRSASTQSVPTTAATHPQNRRLLAPPPLPQRQQQQKQQSTGIPLDSLTNAIVAGSLATSRLTPSMSSSTSKKPPSPPPSRRHTPLRMRQTLREPPSSGKGKNKSDDEDSEATRRHKHRHRKKPFGQKGKHAHHEGQRKRWREEITPRERKRYEGVWASNRGYLLVDGKRAGDRAGASQQRTPPNQSQSLGLGSSQSRSLSQTQQPPTRASRDAPPRAVSTEVSNNTSTSSSRDLIITKSYDGDGEGDGDLVANVVVRDLWARSRLPADELAEVWDLVDVRGRGALDRAEFVVGTWLVDQRLRGRKIPRKVSDSVWSSARSGAGVRVRVKGVKGK
ncbi:Increased rDNA silencing protein [Diatrype stigma]|uniref:Increased rDNA silencing protein n=1 Tax=Diatrype stigma TaxID=117547 RepID=A0AAN9URJ2_9PEZI